MYSVLDIFIDMSEVVHQNISFTIIMTMLSSRSQIILAFFIK